LWIGASAQPKGLWAKISDKLGELSYPLYVLHSPLIASAAFVWLQLDWGNVRRMDWAPSVGVALVIFAIAFAASAFYDKPVRRWLSRGVRAKPLQGGLAQPQES
jgi:peptidoglycan/LPS O-acetylase OafA/YrhL